MLNDILELFIEIKNKIISSRIFMLLSIHIILVFILVAKLFNMQIVHGEDYLNNYIQMTEKTIMTPSARGNIYDRHGKVLAYNKLIYSVNIQDNGYYKNYNDRNAMLYRLVQILNNHEEEVIGNLPIKLDENNEYVFTTPNELAKKRFLRDFYGLKSIEDLDKDGKNPSDATARDLIESKFKAYRLYELKDDRGNPIILTELEKLQIINIKYTMSFTAFHKYDATKVVNSISENTKADLLENASLLLGVNIEEETIRVYNDSIYFSSIVGYTGKVQENQLEILKQKNPDYVLNDTVGRIGIEQYMEEELQGTKGYKIINVDNVGHIIEVKYQTEAKSGNDVYLTIDRDLQVGTYHLLEQQLAGILATKLVNIDDPNTENTDSTERRIPIKDAYFQLINNNVLSLDSFKNEKASDNEKNIYNKFKNYKEESLNALRAELTTQSPTLIRELEDDKKAFMYYIFNKLSSEEIAVINKNLINANSDYYLRWKNDDISLREFLYTGIADNWVDTTKLNISNKYSDANDIFNSLVGYILEILKDDESFEKIIYKYMIKKSLITGRELCLALYDQGILEYDEKEVEVLTANGENYAYTFMIKKISDVEITPAQLALDPCTAGAVIVDTNTGEVRALVSYPGYDTNRLANNMDIDYYNKLFNDQSLPFYNNATQTRKAPGSTFKPIATIAGLEERVMSPAEKIACTGLYDEINPAIKCWIYPGMHGELNAVEAIQNSCNYYFSEVGHRLSTDDKGEYNAKLGIEKLSKYATLFGLDHKSGIEIEENEPLISGESPEQSAMGQGTHSYANVQLSRYVTALANRGTLFELSLLDKVVDSKGNLVSDYTPSISSHIDISDNTWDNVHVGMRKVVELGSASKIFKDLEVNIAGKTGTAQETRNRANHAFFISFAPVSSPEISVTVNIPYGYSSSNAANAAKNIYKYYFGYTSLDYILSNGALNVSDVKIGD